MNDNDFAFWRRWVAANSIGETIGLGTTFLVGFGIIAKFGESSGWISVLLFAGVAVLLGMFEGFVVGAAQGSVIAQRLADFKIRSWVMATMIGALLAWTLGMLPSTLTNLAASAASSAPPMEMPDWIVYLLAMPLGAVAGLILASAQWVVLRHWVTRASWWLPANALAWLVGMPIIFVGTSVIQPDMSAFQAAALMLIAIAVTGAVIGAIHGWCLIKILLIAQKLPTESVAAD
jgi:uncharacterized membrane protein